MVLNLAKEYRRIKVRGRYYRVTRDSSGKFNKVEKWGVSYNHDAMVNRLAKKFKTKHRRQGVDILSRGKAIEVAVSPNDVRTSIGQLKRSRAGKKYMAVPRPLVRNAKRQLAGSGIGIMTSSGKIEKRSRRRPYI